LGRPLRIGEGALAFEVFGDALAICGALFLNAGKSG